MKKRNPYALAGLSRKAGRHKDRKKEADKDACRNSHGEYCNCEDCVYARGAEICATCGCLIGYGCPCSAP